MRDKEVLAIVPARGGSKGIPRKNIRPFVGHPLIAYSIAAGLQAKLVTRVIVTTDDEEIAGVARKYGAEIPFMRPAELAQDLTTDLPVFQHALNWLAEHENYHPDVVVHLRPTSPVRPPDLVDRSARILLEHPEADSVRGLTPASQNPFKMWLMDGEDKPIRPLMTVPGVEESYNAPRQVLPVAYAHCVIDAMRPNTILGMNSMSGRAIMPVLFDPVYSVDLDTPDDWQRAEERIMRAGPPMVWPGHPRRPMPAKIQLIVLDFDGVLTDNRVWVDQDGREMVAANRSDSLMLKKLVHEKGIPVIVLSTETNPVVAARSRKMGIPCIQGENDKATAIKKLLKEHGIDAEHVVYCGNDLNDLPCFPLVGWAVAVADAVPEVAQQADYVLSQAGGHGAVGELCGLILAQNQE